MTANDCELPHEITNDFESSVLTQVEMATLAERAGEANERLEWLD